MLTETYLGCLGFAFKSDGIALRGVAYAKTANFATDDALADLLLLNDARQVQIAFGIACKLSWGVGLLLDEKMNAQSRLGQVVDDAIGCLSGLQLCHFRLCAERQAAQQEEDYALNFKH